MVKKQISISDNVTLAENITIIEPVNLYGCQIGDNSFVGPFVEIQSDVTIGARCKISSHSFICSGVILEDEVFIGHGVMFVNDKYPTACNKDGTLKSKADWKQENTRVRKGASIGSNTTILGGITIGEGAMIGAGSVVTKDIPAGEIWAGNPARQLKGIEHEEESHSSRLR